MNGYEEKFSGHAVRDAWRLGCVHGGFISHFTLKIMTLFFVVLASLVAFHIAVCGVVTYKLNASLFYEPHQKRLQLIILWCLPVIGAILVWMFLHPERPVDSAALEADEDEIEESVFSDKSSSHSSIAEVSGSD